MPYFHRLVVQTPYLEWRYGLDIEFDGVEIHFVTEVTGRAVQPTVQRQVGDHITIEGGGQESTTHSGKFVEIICDAENAAKAELRSRAVLGFLSFCLGDVASGDLVFSEIRYGDSKDEVLSIYAESDHYYPASLDSQSQHLLAMCLPRITKSVELLDALALAFRWYEHGITSDNIVDRIISFYVGIEAILKNFSKQSRLESSLAGLGRNPGFVELIRSVSESQDDEAVQRLIGNLISPSNRERFVAYSRKNHLPERWGERFDRLSKIRNRTVHSGADAPSENDALDAQYLLRIMIRKELHLIGLMPADMHPGRDRGEVRWSKDEGWITSSRVDWLSRMNEIQAELEQEFNESGYIR